MNSTTNIKKTKGGNTGVSGIKAAKGADKGTSASTKGEVRRAPRKRTRGGTAQDSQEPGTSYVEKKTVDKGVLEGSDTEVNITEVSSESDSEGSFVPAKIRKRGRPPTTGVHLMAQKRQEHRKEIRKLQEEKRALMEILDPRVLPRSRMRDTTPERELNRQFLDMTAERIASNMYESIDVVEKVARRSSHLKGTFVKALVNSSNTLRAAVMAFVRKATVSREGTATHEEEDVSRGLREKVRELENQLAEAECKKVQEEAEKNKSRPGQSDEGMELDAEELETPPPLAPVTTTFKKPVVVIKRMEPFKGAVKVLRPEVRGRTKEIEEDREEAMSGARRVMEGISIDTIAKEEDPTLMRAKLEDIILRCQGVLSRLPVKEGKGEGKVADRAVPRLTPPDKGRGGSRGRAERTKGASTKPDNKEMPKQQRTSRQMQAKVPQKEEQPKAVKKADPPQRRETYAEAAKKPARRTQPEVGKRAPSQGPKGRKEGKNAPRKGEAETQPAADKRSPKQAKRRTPRSEAVAISFPAGEFAQGMREIRSKIDLDKLGIGPLKQRKALTGALILEVAGEKKTEKANLLAEQIRKAVGNKEGVRVMRPSKMGEIRIKDLDESVTQEELQEVVAKAGECDKTEVKVGQLKTAPGGMITVWVQCPLAVAKKVAEKRRVRVGWASARVELLDARPLVCFRCLERGHVRQQCRNPVDRSGTCYRCGQEGHKAQECTAVPQCSVCVSRGLPAKHKAGGAACPPLSKKAEKKARQAGRQKSGGGEHKGVRKEVKTAEQAMETEPLAEVQQRAGPAAIIGGEGQEEAERASLSTC
ncbi:PREDICTED: actin cytoskeleton-regulatory complex protein pan1-like [Vollenhovia emeryi]|uniref:actin cytoskeleton-regulatory complex protein pan1-like n=1 Tax=Vollenhovia emeryi TaxID=411798 RepID=UPI0005F3DD49|nr:PREDICTED: actin cytoskeleton-regulatory complex protein pan1-like [Vollenhovia emeryi]